MCAANPACPRAPGWQDIPNRQHYASYLGQEVLEDAVEGAAIVEALQAELHKVAHRLRPGTVKLTTHIPA